MVLIPLATTPRMEFRSKKVDVLKVPGRDKVRLSRVDSHTPHPMVPPSPSSTPPTKTDSTLKAHTCQHRPRFPRPSDEHWPPTRRDPTRPTTGMPISRNSAANRSMPSPSGDINRNVNGEPHPTSAHRQQYGITTSKLSSGLTDSGRSGPQWVKVSALDGSSNRL